VYVFFFLSVTSKYLVDEPIIYKLSEFKKTEEMKNQHVLLKIKEPTYCSGRCCHQALESSNFMTILNSKAQSDPILAYPIYSYNVVLVAGRNILPLISKMRSLIS
jgi:hypothetical protein